MSDFVQFLITNISEIEPDWIVKFFTIVPESYDADRNLTIKIEDVIEFTGIQKKHIVEKLRANFEEGTDFVPEEKETNNGNGKQKRDYMLTPKCFKNLCLKINTKRMKDKKKAAAIANVANYYLQLEVWMKVYSAKKFQDQKDKIKKQDKKIKQLQDSVDMLKFNEIPKHVFGDEDPGEVYMQPALNLLPIEQRAQYKNIKQKKGKILVKIGANGKNKTKGRENTYNGGNANKVKKFISLKVKDPFTVEACIQALLRRYHVKGASKEIFYVNLKIAAEAFNRCVEMVKGLNKWVTEKGLQKYAEVNKKYQRLANEEVILHITRKVKSFKKKTKVTQ